jgi:hypothetical protein
MGVPSFLTQIMDDMKFLDHWLFAWTERRTDTHLPNVTAKVATTKMMKKFHVKLF